MYPCSICGRISTSKKDGEDHLREHFPDRSPESKDVNWNDRLFLVFAAIMLAALAALTPLAAYASGPGGGGAPAAPRGCKFYTRGGNVRLSVTGTVTLLHNGRSVGKRTEGIYNLGPVSNTNKLLNWRCA